MRYEGTDQKRKDSNIWNGDIWKDLEKSIL